eukprot:361554-Pelagomonas_calceolata.AAC.3
MVSTRPASHMVLPRNYGRPEICPPTAPCNVKVHESGKVHKERAAWQQAQKDKASRQLMDKGAPLHIGTQARQLTPTCTLCLQSQNKELQLGSPVCRHSRARI